MKNESKQRENEKKFSHWEKLPNGGRRYYFEILGRYGWKARYIKEVDSSEKTTKFYQEIFDENSQLIEIHEKYPIDKGHIEIIGDK